MHASMRLESRKGCRIGFKSEDDGLVPVLRMPTGESRTILLLAHPYRNLSRIFS